MYVCPNIFYLGLCLGKNCSLSSKQMEYPLPPLASIAKSFKADENMDFTLL